MLEILKSIEESRLLVKGNNETIKNETKKQKVGLLPMLLGTLAASLLGSELIRREVIRAGKNF